MYESEIEKLKHQRDIQLQELRSKYEQQLKEMETKYQQDMELSQAKNLKQIKTLKEELHKANSRKVHLNCFSSLIMEDCYESKSDFSAIESFFSQCECGN